MQKTKIVFDDGRRGYQITDAQGDLLAVVITREADGQPCCHVYAEQGDIRADVFDFGDLAPATWEIES